MRFYTPYTITTWESRDGTWIIERNEASKAYTLKRWNGSEGEFVIIDWFTTFEDAEAYIAIDSFSKEAV